MVVFLRPDLWDLSTGALVRLITERLDAVERNRNRVCNARFVFLNRICQVADGM